MFLYWINWTQIQRWSTNCHGGITLAFSVELLTVNRSTAPAGSSAATFHSLLGLVHQASVS